MNKKICLISLLFLLTFALAGCGSAAPAGEEEPNTEATDLSEESAYEESTYYDAEFHRGGRDARPENTLYAFQYAIENGASAIECDMQMTKDGELVMTHNSILNPDITMDKDGNYVEEGKYIVNQMTLEELQEFNVGHINKDTEYYDLHGRTQIPADTTIPTLREFFELVRDSGDEDIKLSIEAKGYPDPACGVLYETRNDPEEVIPAFDRLVREFGFEDRVLLQSMDWAFLRVMKKVDPDIKTVGVYSEEPDWGEADSVTLWLDKEEASPWLGGLNIHDFDDDPLKVAEALDIDVVSPYFGEIDEDYIKEAHSLGIRVVVWTVNTPEDIEKMYDMGVDGIISDRPWILREVLEAKGADLPPKNDVDLPYHLDKDHVEAESGNSEGGNDAAY